MLKRNKNKETIPINWEKFYKEYRKIKEICKNTSELSTPKIEDDSIIIGCRSYTLDKEFFDKLGKHFNYTFETRDYAEIKVIIDIKEEIKLAKGE